MYIKRYLQLYLWFQIFLLITLITLPGFADDTNLKTSVPDYHTIEFDLGSGKVIFKNTTYTGKSSIKVERLSDVALHFTAPDGYTINHIYKDGKDVTNSVASGYYTIKGINANCRFSASYALKSSSGTSSSSTSSSTTSSSPKTGDSANMPLYVSLSLFCIVALIWLNKLKEAKDEKN